MSKYSGSIVLKRKDYLSVVANLKAIWNSTGISHDTRATVFGELIGIDLIADAILKPSPDWDTFMQEVFMLSWAPGNLAGCLKFLDSDPSEYLYCARGG